jgi:ABC-type dipeptide/oligopeptide/nickel transport system permease subunit
VTVRDRRSWLGRRPRLAWAVVVTGAVLMVAGVVWGMLAPTLDGTFLGLIVEILGVLVAIPGLHAVIDG